MQKITLIFRKLFGCIWHGWTGNLQTIRWSERPIRQLGEGLAELENADRIYPTKSWPERILRGKFRLAAKIACKDNRCRALCSRCQPGHFWETNFPVQPRRRPGRPPKRWDAQHWAFSNSLFHSSWTTAAHHRVQWLSHEQVFVQFCLEPWCLNVELFSHVPRGP